jgi:hypothetical protein
MKKSQNMLVRLNKMVSNGPAFFDRMLRLVKGSAAKPN